MTNRQTFRFGRLDPSSGSPPTASALDNRVTPGTLSQRGPRGLQEQARNVAPLQSHGGMDYFYFTYVTEVVDDDVELDQQGGDQQLTVQPRRIQRVAYFEDGSYIFETNDDIDDQRLAGFLLDSHPVGSSDFTVYDDIDQTFLRRKYSSANEVRKISFSNIGSNNPNGPVDREIDELGQEAISANFSTGHNHNNLNQSTLVGRFSSRCDIEKFSLVKQNSDSTIIFNNNGRVTTSFPENVTPGQEAIAILNDTYDVLDHLTP